MNKKRMSILHEFPIEFEIFQDRHGAARGAAAGAGAAVERRGAEPGAAARARRRRGPRLRHSRLNALRGCLLDRPDSPISMRILSQLVASTAAINRRFSYYFTKLLGHSH